MDMVRKPLRMHVRDENLIQYVLDQALDSVVWSCGTIKMITAV